MIIVGLGNPGATYTSTRHNVGFVVVDELREIMTGTPWKNERQVTWSQIGPHLLIKPMDFMNNSGQALGDWLRYKHLDPDPSDLVVVHDDLDLPVGTVKPDVDRSSGGHQGVQNIIDILGTQNIRRLRVGIGSNRVTGIPAEDFVLQAIPNTDQPLINQSIDQACAWLAAEMKKKSHNG